VLLILTSTGNVLLVVLTSVSLNDLKIGDFGEFLRFSAAE